MPFHYLKTNQSAALIFYAPWAVIAWLPHLLQISDFQSFNTFPFSLIPLNFTIDATLQVSLGLICITLQAFQFNQMVNQAQLLGRETYLHGAMYILLASMIYPHGALTDQMFSMFFIIPAAGRWWTLADQRSSTSVCFDAAFLVSIATLLYLPNAVLLLQAYVSLMIFRTFNPREALYTLIGFGLPQLFWFTLVFVIQWPWWQPAGEWTEFTWTQTTVWISWFIAAGTWVFMALLHYLSVTPQQVIRVRKMRSLVLWYLFFSMVAGGAFYMLTHHFSFPYIALLPLAIFTSGFIHMPARPGFAIFLSYAAWLMFVYASCYGLINSY